MNKRKINMKKIFKIFIVIIAIFTSIYLYLHSSDNNYYSNYFIVPAFFGICLYFSKDLNYFDFKSPGVLVLNFTMIIKYIVMPIIMCVGKYYSWLGVLPSYFDFNVGIILTIIEILSIFVMSNILEHKRLANNKMILEFEKKVKPLKHTVFHMILIIIGFACVILVPKTVADYRFIFNTNNLATTITVDFQFSGIYKTLFIFARYLTVLIIINYLYKRNKKKKNIMNVFMAFIPVTLNCLYVSNLSRISIFVPLLSFSIIIFLLFNDKKERKFIIKMLMIVMIFGITFMSAVKFFGAGRGNENMSKNIGWWGDTLNMYFSGPKETAIGVKATNLVNELYGWKRYKLLLNDAFSNVIGLSNFTQKNNSTIIYNYIYFSSSIAVCQIVPNIIEGYYYFGILFCWLWPCLFVYLCFFFDKKAQCAETLDLKFAFIYAEIYCGMYLMINSSMIIANITNVSILLWILSKINNKILIKR